LGRRDAEAAKTGAAMTFDAALAKGKSWDAPDLFDVHTTSTTISIAPRPLSASPVLPRNFGWLTRGAMSVPRGVWTSCSVPRLRLKPKASRWCGQPRCFCIQP
jgi:hypothetical protein